MLLTTQKKCKNSEKKGETKWSNKNKKKEN